jgi:hypothetical protein
VAINTEKINLAQSVASAAPAPPHRKLCVEIAVRKRNRKCGLLSLTSLIAGIKHLVGKKT